ncbi:MAG: IS21 family transposase [Deltaproteobacteria bacterium]|nr:IS21 family transposase [Deltaproteobacteria bacterium]
MSHAAMKGDMDRKTARRYRDLGCLPSEAGPERTWRTRPDPFAEDWPDIEASLKLADDLDAKTLFEDLVARKPGRYEPGQLRTLQRHVRRWRAQEGAPKRVFFAQNHVPGEAMQTDFTVCDELAITICGVPFPHRLCHPVLPYSNWEWASICHSESLPAMKVGVQEALQQLGGVPKFHQTDHSTAATHQVSPGSRGFNLKYLAWMEHMGMTPRTTDVGEKEQNGDVEALNGALKHRLNQHLLLRGSRDFDGLEAYVAFVHGVLRGANSLRGVRVAEERALLQPLPKSWYPEYIEERPKVTQWSTIRVRFNTYSVPSRLRGEELQARVYDDRIEVWYAGRKEASIDRLQGRNGHRIDYRDVIWSLVTRPGAFARYRYREDLFPSLVFRRTYDALAAAHVVRIADLEYVRILHLAASTSQSDVEDALAATLEVGGTFVSETIRAMVRPRQAMPPVLSIPAPDLASYDTLIGGVAA